MLSLLLDAMTRGVEFEWPQEIIGLFKMWTHCPDLMHQILHADDVVLSQCLTNAPLSQITGVSAYVLNDLIVLQCNAITIHLEGV